MRAYLSNMSHKGHPTLYCIIGFADVLVYELTREQQEHAVLINTGGAIILTY